MRKKGRDLGVVLQRKEEEVEGLKEKLMKVSEELDVACRINGGSCNLSENNCVISVRKSGEDSLGFSGKRGGNNSFLRNCIVNKRDFRI